MLMLVSALFCGVVIGVLVATMGLGKAGASNAALLAVQILGLKDSALVSKMRDYREKMASQVESKSKKIQQDL